MDLLPSRYIGADVEWTDERERHVTHRHPDLLPRYRAQVVETVSDPDEVRKSSRASNARLFTRWFPDVMGGKHIVAVVVSETGPSQRHWVLTAYLAQRLGTGDTIEWKRS